MKSEPSTSFSFHSDPFTSSYLWARGGKLHVRQKGGGMERSRRSKQRNVEQHKKQTRKQQGSKGSRGRAVAGVAA